MNMNTGAGACGMAAGIAVPACILSYQKANSSFWFCHCFVCSMLVPTLTLENASIEKTLCWCVEQSLHPFIYQPTPAPTGCAAATAVLPPRQRSTSPPGTPPAAAAASWTPWQGGSRSITAGWLRQAGWGSPHALSSGTSSQGGYLLALFWTPPLAMCSMCLSCSSVHATSCLRCQHQ